MPPQSSSGWVPPHGWFFALAGLVVVETAWLVATLRHQSAPPRIVYVSRAAALPPAVPAPLASPAPAETEDEAASVRPETDPLTRALRTRPSLRRSHRFEDLGAALAKADPHEALRVLQGLPPDDRLVFVRGMFDTLGQGDRHAAVSMLREITDEREQSTAVATLFESWRGETVHAATAQAPNAGSYGAAAWGMQLLQADPVDVDLVLQWAHELTTGEGQAELLGGLAGKTMRTDPARALTYGDGLDKSGRRVFVENFFSSLQKDLLKSQPQELLTWSNQLSDPLLRDALDSVLLNTWIERDPQAAAQAVLSLPTGEVRQDSLRAVAAKLATMNTAAADGWVQSLSGDERAAASAVVDGLTPVGIGAGLGTDQEGNFVVQTLIDNMPAALSGQIHPGDRLIGVVRSDGALVKTSDLDLAQTINLVRGRPASTVQLQVAQLQGNGGYSPPTMVTLVRQRITKG